MSDCPEIQGGAHIPNHNDGFYYCRSHECLMDYCDGGYLWCQITKCNSDDWVWLPRQDQIQDMLDNNYHPDNLEKILGYFLDFTRQNPMKFNSYEQLWLAFYMKEKHNLTWSGKEWV